MATRVCKALSTTAQLVAPEVAVIAAGVLCDRKRDCGVLVWGAAYTVLDADAGIVVVEVDATCELWGLHEGGVGGVELPFSWVFVKCGDGVKFILFARGLCNEGSCVWEIAAAILLRLLSPLWSICVDNFLVLVQ